MKMWVFVCVALFAVSVGVYLSTARGAADVDSAPGQQLTKLLAAHSLQEMQALVTKWREGMQQDRMKALIAELVARSDSKKPLQIENRGDWVLWSPSDRLKEADRDKVLLSHDVATEGGRCRWALEQLLLYTIPRRADLAIPEPDTAPVPAVTGATTGPVSAPDGQSQDPSLRARLSKAGDPKSDEHVLSELAADADPQVRLAVAENPSTSFLVLWRLARDPSADVVWAAGKALDRDQVVTAVERGMPPAPIGWPKTLPLGSRLPLAADVNLDGRVLRELAQDDDPSVRLAVARNRNAPFLALWKLSHDPVAEIAEAAVQNMHSARTMRSTGSRIKWNGRTERAAGPATAATPDNRDNVYDEIIVFGNNDWFLNIRPSGGGTYGFGDGGAPFLAKIPSGTFNFKDAATQCFAASQARKATDADVARRRSESGWYGIGFAHPGQSLTEMRDTRDVALIRRLYATAIKATPPGPELAKVLATRPPVPADAAPTPNPAAQQKAERCFFTIDDGKTWFAGSADRLPPCEINGRLAVQACVFASPINPGAPFVAYLMQYDNAAKAALQQARAEGRSPTAEEQAVVLKGTLVKRPGDQKWRSLPDAADITTIHTPGGKPVPVVPTE